VVLEKQVGVYTDERENMLLIFSLALEKSLSLPKSSYDIGTLLERRDNKMRCTK
jgi:hypothetical protein